jgi:acyl carrier protein/short-subunit dehydrogenase
METSGAKVRVVQGDVAELTSARRIVAEAGASLRGVWHCAGVIDDGALAEQSWERFATVMNPKVEGSWNLHELTRELRPDFFVLFSSWASIAGSRGQANYSAANAFLDGLAAHRRAEGLPALCVDWGAWGETGMAASETMQRYLARAGMESMRPQDAFTALSSALRTGEPRLAIAAIQWPTYLEQVPSSQRSFYAELAHEVESAGKLRDGSPATRSGNKAQSLDDARASKGGRVLSEILASPASARRDRLQGVIEDVVRRTLDLRPSDEIDPEETFNDLGMDSLLAIELRNSLSTILERRLPSTLLFDYPTLRKLARFMEEELFPDVLREETAAVALLVEPEPDGDIGTLSILDEIERLSDDEVDSILEKGAY